jgi:hypothetical protein
MAGAQVKPGKALFANAVAHPIPNNGNQATDNQHVEDQQYALHIRGSLPWKS